MGNPLLRAARAYAERGWRIIPLHWIAGGGCSCARGEQCRTPGKHPTVAGWVDDGSTDRHTIESWWGSTPLANVGVVTGAMSRIVVIDIDPRHGGDENLVELQQTYAQLPETPMVLTGGGGQHFYFSSTEPLPACQLGPGLDFQAEGRLVVAPPSLHASGRQYCWEASADLDDVPLAPLPGWVHALALDHQLTAAEGVALPEVLPNVTLADLKVSARLKFLIAMGWDCHQPERYPSRSEAVFACVVGMIAADHDDATIAAVLLNPRYRISEKPRTQKNARNPLYERLTRAWLAKEIARGRQAHKEHPVDQDSKAPMRRQALKTFMKRSL
jgi:Bifunctional DNA primase/polymerase, N-terminal